MGRLINNNHIRTGSSGSLNKKNKEVKTKRRGKEKRLVLLLLSFVSWGEGNELHACVFSKVHANFYCPQFDDSSTGVLDGGPAGAAAFFLTTFVFFLGDGAADTTSCFTVVTGAAGGGGGGRNTINL